MKSIGLKMSMKHFKHYKNVLESDISTFITMVEGCVPAAWRFAAKQQKNTFFQKMPKNRQIWGFENFKNRFLRKWGPKSKIRRCVAINMIKLIYSPPIFFSQHHCARLSHRLEDTSQKCDFLRAEMILARRCARAGPIKFWISKTCSSTRIDVFWSLYRPFLTIRSKFRAIWKLHVLTLKKKIKI